MGTVFNTSRSIAAVLLFGLTSAIGSGLRVGEMVRQGPIRPPGERRFGAWSSVGQLDAWTRPSDVERIKRQKMPAFRLVGRLRTGAGAERPLDHPGFGRPRHGHRLTGRHYGCRTKSLAVRTPRDPA